jgi:hypothetical protein
MDFGPDRWRAGEMQNRRSIDYAIVAEPARS